MEGVGLAVGLAALLGACGGSQGGREAWLARTIVQDNLQQHTADPSVDPWARRMLAGKYQKMAASPYAYFRGTLGQLYRDLQRPSPLLRTDFASPAVILRLVGDPHPENIGSFKPGGRPLRVEFNDFDASAYGPYYLDLWRMMQGFSVAAAQAPQQYPAGAQEGLLTAVAEAYLDQLKARAGGAARVPLEGGGVVIDDLLRRAARDGDDREALQTFTQLRGQERSLRRGVLEQEVVPGVIASQLASVTPTTEAHLRALLRSYGASLVSPQSQSALQVKELSRYLGSGVASYALPRYYLLLEGPTAAPGDDWLVEMKASVDPPALQSNLRQGSTHPNNAARVVGAQRSLQSTPDADALLGWVGSEGESYKLRDRRKYQKGFKFERMQRRLRQGRWSLADVRVFAAQCGRLLADAHADAPTLTGQPAAPAILATIGERGPAFVGEAVERSAGYGAQLLEDHASFRQLLRERGPYLGAR